MSPADDTSGDGSVESYEGDHEWGPDEVPSEVLLEQVARVRGTDVTELPRLYDAVDPDALDQLVTGTESTEGFPVEVAFAFARLTVTVRSDGFLRIAPADGNDGDGNSG